MTLPRSLLLATLTLTLTAAAGCANTSLDDASPDGRLFVQPKKTIVLVHGAWGGSWAFRETDRLLTNDGWKVYRPSLTGQGERVHLASPDIDLSTHIQDVVNEILYEDLHNVVLVGHSYGGMVITGVADRATERIGKVVYLDAANPVNGQSLVDVSGPIIEAVRPMGETVDGVELVLLPAPGAAAFYGVTDPDDTAWMDARLTGHPWRCFDTPLRLTNEEVASAIPHFHIVCTSTLATRDKTLMAQARAAGRLWD
ncbi:MAG TPA: alpha/beta hydrolase family protein, partial [Phycisphaerae bacterium]|nr:alpha/beta hydrolase family protein [Phycisphaerae bacterium]